MQETNTCKVLLDNCWLSTLLLSSARRARSARGDDRGHWSDDVSSAQTPRTSSTLRNTLSVGVHLVALTATILSIQCWEAVTSLFFLVVIGYGFALGVMSPDVFARNPGYCVCLENSGSLPIPDEMFTKALSINSSLFW